MNMKKKSATKQIAGHGAGPTYMKIGRTALLTGASAMAMAAISPAALAQGDAADESEF